MTTAANSSPAVKLTTPVFATTGGHPRPAVVPGRLRRAAVTIGDLLVGLGIVLSIPFVILALGIPIALGGRFLLWLAGLL